VIAAHCGNEAGVATAVVTTASSVPVILAVFRARLGEFVDRLWRRR
jgi:hypothetical protein